MYSKYNDNRNRGEDPIITELKEKSKQLKLQLVRGGDKIRGLSVVTKNKK